ncbi:MAG: hypothetical protein ACRBDL_06805 [Alphaproteobacteria bacterium]
MAGSVPLSVRISQDDASFIAGLEIDDAVTPSDKVRAIIKQARERHGQRQDYSSMMTLAKDIFRDEKEAIKDYEFQNKVHSELIMLYTEWLTESFAHFGAAVDTAIDPDAPNKKDFKMLEEEIAKRIFRLLDMVTRMGVTKNAPCYDPKLIHKHYEPLLELTEMVGKQLEKGD